MPKCGFEFKMHVVELYLTTEIYHSVDQHMYYPLMNFNTSSDDISIKNVTTNDICMITTKCNIRQIFTNGRKADVLYRRYIEDKTKITAICLPSTSPANAALSTERLIGEWSSQLNKYLQSPEF